MGKDYLKSDCLKSFYLTHDNFSLTEFFFYERKKYAERKFVTNGVVTYYRYAILHRHYCKRLIRRQYRARARPRYICCER